KPTAK
ncbi:pfkB carbohydrate kinase family protein, partial [Vibrio parahaemolyticus V-223/04]